MKTIAVIMPELRVTYQRGTMRGIMTFVTVNPDWHIELIPRQREALSRLTEIDPAGLIIQEPQKDSLLPKNLAERPLVSLYKKINYPNAFFVTCDNVACGRLMARHLLDCGGRRFAFVGVSKTETIVARQRLAGFRQELPTRQPIKTYPSPYNKMRMPGLHWNHTKWHRGLIHWLKNQPKPLAIGAYDDVLGYAVLEACRSLSLRVPKDVMVIGVNNDKLFCSLSQPELSSVSIPWQRIGMEAIRLLTQKIEGKRKLPHKLAIPPVRVVPRASTDLSLAVNEDVTAATKFIRTNVSDPNLDVPQVVSAAAMSRSSLERRFQKYLGCTILEQIQRTRLTQAKRLLVETGLPMKAIAQRTGFKSIDRMAKLFQQDMNMPPREFRARFRYPTTS